MSAIFGQCLALDIQDEPTNYGGILTENDEQSDRRLQPTDLVAIDRILHDSPEDDVEKEFIEQLTEVG